MSALVAFLGSSLVLEGSIESMRASRIIIACCQGISIVWESGMPILVSAISAVVYGSFSFLVLFAGCS